MTNKAKAVLFDIDDTLFDRREAQSEVLQQIITVLPDLFSGLNSKQIDEAFSKSDEISTQEFTSGASIDDSRESRSRYFLQFLNLDQHRCQEIAKLYLEYYPKIIAPVEGAQSTIHNLAQKLQVGIISNGSPAVQYQKLNNLGIKQYLSCIILSEEIGIRKPDTRIFQEAASRIGQLPENCLYVGDSIDADITGAKNAGMISCWFNPRQIQQTHSIITPDFEIFRLAQLIKIINAL
jgi:HAD superfamily hydrolase (TIGR01549 family)